MKMFIKKHHGFTLLEAVVALGIAALVLTFATDFFIQTTWANYVTSQRINQSIEMRKFTQELIYHASRANQFFLYKSQTTAADWASPANELAIDGSGNHPAGDFVVFVYYEVPNLTPTNYYRIKMIVGYYLDGSANQIATIKKVVIDLSKDNTNGSATPNDQVLDYDTTNKKTVVEQVMINNWSQAKHTRFSEFILSARGLLESEIPAEAASNAGRLFYYRDPQNVMVAGQLSGSKIGNKRAYTDTFNFSITPRS